MEVSLILFLLHENFPDLIAVQLFFRTDFSLLLIHLDITDIIYLNHSSNLRLSAFIIMRFFHF